MKKLIDYCILGYPEEYFLAWWFIRLIFNYGLINTVIDVFNFLRKNL